MSRAGRGVPVRRLGSSIGEEARASDAPTAAIPGKSPFPFVNE